MRVKDEKEEMERWGPMVSERETDICGWGAYLSWEILSFSGGSLEGVEGDDDDGCRILILGAGRAGWASAGGTVGEFLSRSEDMMVWWACRGRFLEADAPMREGDDMAAAVAKRAKRGPRGIMPVEGLRWLSCLDLECASRIRVGAKTVNAAHGTMNRL